MRIDKYLKVARLIKRRTVAKEACDGGRISVNGKIAKPGTDVVPGDQIELRFGSGDLLVKVLETPESASKEKAAELYEVIEQRRRPSRPWPDSSADIE
ncbi:MAG TPA: RNA-binding S4 domain-containing protein [Clostridiales bacterium]|jgi:ribosomal 50S subunit-recycling heat shock protein|nr:RNA-binding S4 domain-containing protein [Clostridiales bacterium]